MIKLPDFTSTVQGNNYRPKMQEEYCSTFNVSHNDFMVVSHRDNVYGPGLQSERASFRPKRLTVIEEINNIVK